MDPLTAAYCLLPTALFTGVGLGFWLGADWAIRGIRPRLELCRQALAAFDRRRRA